MYWMEKWLCFSISVYSEMKFSQDLTKRDKLKGSNIQIIFQCSDVTAINLTNF